MKLWEVGDGDLYIINNEKKNLCIVDYYSKFPALRKVRSMSAKDLIQAIKAIFTEFGLCKKLVSDAGMYFVLEQFKEFCRCLNIDQV